MQTTAALTVKKHLLAVSVWSDDDIAIIDTTTAQINTWTLPKHFESGLRRFTSLYFVE